MKKKLTNVTLLLATTLIASSCGNDVTYKKVESGDKAGQSIIWSIKKDDGKVEYYTADDLLADLQDSSTARTKLYNEVSRQVFTAYGEKTISADEKKSIEEAAAEKVDEFKKDAKAKAKENKTDYDKYLETALASAGVETLDELKDLYVYQDMKTEILEDFIEDPNWTESSNRERRYNYFLRQYLNAYTPFQVKHILVAANTADVNYKDGTMSVDNARKLLNILNRFIDGDTFASIADLTDDTSSKDNGGIMPFNQAQNYVSEFRFAPYALEVFGNSETTDEQRFEIARDLHLVEELDDNLTEAEKTAKLAEIKTDWEDSSFYKQFATSGIGGVNLSTILTLNDKVQPYMAGAYNYYTYADATGVNESNYKDFLEEKTFVETGLTRYVVPTSYSASAKYVKATEKAGVDIPTVAEQTYEMNVSKFDDNGNINAKYYEEYELARNQIFNVTLNSHKPQYIILDGAYSSIEKNKTIVKVNGVDTTVLADGNGNPIYFVLASTGIHFMANVYNSYANTDKQNETYFTLFDSSDSSANYKEKYENTYIGQNGAYLNKTTLQSNSDSLLSDISSYVSNAEYYLFDALVYSDNSLRSDDIQKMTIKFYDEGNELYDLIKDYVKDSIKSTDTTFASSVKSAVEAYGSKLDREAEVDKSMDNWLFVNRKD